MIVKYMTGSLMLLITACGIALISRAAEPVASAGLQDANLVLVCPETLLRGCCDGYCSKTQPCVPCYRRGCGCDDYCCKPSPCIPCYRGSCVAYCYCPKPCPDLCRPLVADFFSCAAPNAPCEEPVLVGESSPGNPKAPVESSRR